MSLQGFPNSGAFLAAQLSTSCSLALPSSDKVVTAVVHWRCIVNPQLRVGSNPTADTCARPGASLQLSDKPLAVLNLSCTACLRGGMV